METPAYLFNLKDIQSSFEELNELIKPEKLFYAVKANGEKRILKLLNSINANFEIASLGELKKLKDLNVSPDRIICSLPIKTEATITKMYEYGIKYFVFDNINEYEKIKNLAPKSKKILRVFLNDIIPDTISFGMRYSDFKKYMATGQLDTKQVDGLTFYLSDNKNTENLYMVLQEVERFFAVLGSNKLLNIGGNYRLQSEVPSDFYIKLNSELNRLRKKYNTTVYAEPGRSVVKKAGTLLTKVIYFDNEKKYVYIDAGVPTGISYKPPIINNINQNDYKDITEYTFYDITCSHRELFKACLNFNIKINDILEFKNFGSYSICKHSSFHGWPSPKVSYTNA